MKKFILPLIIVIFLFIGCAKHQIQSLRESIVNDAKRYIGVKYKYGGTTPKGFDCSGFVQFIYKRNGILLSRTVSSMERDLRHIKNPRKGDLIVFHNPKHIGIYIGNGLFIHASSSKGVCISSIKQKWYKKRFYGFFTYF